MARTQQEFNQNEIRKLELTINDQDGQDFIPSAAYATILNSSNEIIVVEQQADIDTNKVSITINATTTGTLGRYRILWKLKKSIYTYYHLTELEVVSLLT